MLVLAGQVFKFFSVFLFLLFNNELRINFNTF